MTAMVADYTEVRRLLGLPEATAEEERPSSRQLLGLPDETAPAPMERWRVSFLPHTHAIEIVVKSKRLSIKTFLKFVRTMTEWHKLEPGPTRMPL
jgi:hypothetical protein